MEPLQQTKSCNKKSDLGIKRDGFSIFIFEYFNQKTLTNTLVKIKRIGGGAENNLNFNKT